MRIDRVVIAAVLSIVAGIGVIISYWNGTTSLSLGYPVSDGTKAIVDITTTGYPALIGLSLIGIGALLLLIAFIVAIVAQFRAAPTPHRVEVASRRGIPFEE